MASRRQSWGSANKRGREKGSLNHRRLSIPSFIFIIFFFYLLPKSEKVSGTKEEGVQYPLDLHRDFFLPPVCTQGLGYIVK